MVPRYADPEASRPVTADEIAVIREALDCLSPGRCEAQATDLDRLEVAWTCYCGCDTVTFVHRNPKLPYRELAVGIGTNVDGGDVGVVIWGNDEQVTRLEVCDLGFPDVEMTLPSPSSIRP